MPDALSMRDAIASAIAGFGPGEIRSAPYARAQMLDRRRGTRHTLGTVGVMLSDRPGGSDLGFQVMIVDVSLSGVGFRSPADFTPGAVWRIRIGTGPIFLSSRAKIVSSRPRQDGTFDIGAAFI